MSRKLIIDCDNTFSVPGCDIDDGLAIIYALAQEDLELLGVNTTFGNNTLDVVYPNTLQFMKNIGQENIPVYRGAVDDYKNNEAARFLVDMANKYRGELLVLATGSLTNLYHAYLLNNDIYEKIDKISLMGGITESLVINNKVLNELNFSCNSIASLNVLDRARDITIATGNTCLDGLFTKERFSKLSKGNEFEQWLYKESLYWFHREKCIFDNSGIYIWDILSAAALLNPEYFIENKVTISPDEGSMKTGLLISKGRPRQVTIPKIKDLDQYIEHVYQQYKIYGEKY